jgi:hypothetical protein
MVTQGAVVHLGVPNGRLPSLAVDVQQHDVHIRIAFRHISIDRTLAVH